MIGQWMCGSLDVYMPAKVFRGRSLWQRTPVLTFCNMRPVQEPKAQRPAGMSREAFALLGDSHPIAPSELANELKKPGDAQVGRLLSDHCACCSHACGRRTVMSVM